MRLFALTLLLAGSPLACRKGTTEKVGPAVIASPAAVRSSAEQARQSLRALEPAFAALGEKVRVLHQEFDPLPPGLPGFGETRSRFYSFSIALGALSAKPAWLSGRIDSAVQAGDLAELSAISKDLADTQAQLRQADERAAELLGRVQPFKNAAALKLEELQAQGKTSCE